MKRSKIFSLMLAAAVVSTNLYTAPVFAAETTSNIGLGLANVQTSTSTNSISATFKVTNNGGEAINLSDVKIRYYFTADSRKEQEFHCYNADIADPYRSVTGNVTGEFVKMDNAMEGADTYLEIGFDSSAGTLEAGKTVNVQSSFNKKDWSSYKQDNDYSFNDVEKTVVLVNDNVVSGVAPTKSQGGSTDPADPTKPQVGQAKVEISVSNGSSANSVAPTFTITNTGSDELDLSTLNLKYYYTADGDEAETFNCYYAGTVGGDYQNLTGNVEGKIVKLSPALDNADSYVQVGFNGGTLAAGQSAQVQASVNKDSWQNYDQSNDFSYGNSNNVTAYINNEKVWGTAPGKEEPGQTPSKLKITNVTVDKANLADVTVGIELNGNAFTGIKGLTEGTDYTVSNGSEVVISKNYLGTLPVGDKTLTFNFDKGAAQKLNVNVIDTTVIPPVKKDPVLQTTTADYNKKTPADVNVQVTLNENTLTDIKNGSVSLVKGTDYTVSADGKVVLSQAYLNTLPEGQATNLTFVFSGGQTLTFTVNVIKGVEDGLVIDIPDVKAKAGDTITIPVSIAGVNANGINGCNFKLKYDTALFENVAVTAGDICVNPTKTLFKTIDKTTGTISIMYADSTGKDTEAIVKDGVFVNISLKVKDAATSATSKLEVTKAGKFVDKASKVYTANYKVGTITIGQGEGPVVYPNSTLTSTSGDFEVTAPSAIQVGMNLNGNTLAQIQNGATALVQGKDYTVSGTTVTLSSDYLSTLPVGSADLTFKFNHGDDAKFTVNVTKKEAPSALSAKIGKIEAKAGDTVTLPVTLTAAPTAGIANFSYKIKYDPSVVEVVGIDAGNVITNPDQNFKAEAYPDSKTISVLFIDNALSEEETIKVGGTLSNIKLKIKDNAPKGAMAIEFNNDDNSFYDIDGNEIKVEFANGSINVK